jgi:hypothetical protein
MAIYSQEQLYGAGTPIEELSGSGSCTFNFKSENTASSYFTMETKRNSDGYYNSSSPTNAIGTYGPFYDLSGDTLITSSFIASIVVPPGVSSFEFTPSVAVAGGSSFLRGTGNFTLQITQ